MLITPPRIRSRRLGKAGVGDDDYSPLDAGDVLVIMVVLFILSILFLPATINTTEFTGIVTARYEDKQETMVCSTAYVGSVDSPYTRIGHRRGRTTYTRNSIAIYTTDPSIIKQLEDARKTRSLITVTYRGTGLYTCAAGFEKIISVKPAEQ